MTSLISSNDNGRRPDNKQLSALWHYTSFSRLHRLIIRNIHCLSNTSTSHTCVRKRCRKSLSRFLAKCHKRRLNQGSFLLYFVLFAFCVVFGLCIFLHCFVCQFQSSDWLKRLPSKWLRLCQVTHAIHLTVITRHRTITVSINRSDLRVAVQMCGPSISRFEIPSLSMYVYKIVFALVDVYLSDFFVAV